MTTVPPQGQEEADSWTCGNDPQIRHIKKLNDGANSEMGFIDLADTQPARANNPAGIVDHRSVFARKLSKPFARHSESEILNEFRAIKKLCCEHSHKNIIAVYRYGKLSDSSYYYIDMEFCDLDLEVYIHEPDTVGLSTSRRPPSLLPLHSRSVLQIMRDVSRGLTFIHESHEIHRDLKPTNILYSAEHGVWKIGDFGLTTEGSGVAVTESRRGTASYRAPELLRPIATFDESVDIWAMGCILFELVSGEKPFGDDWYVKDYTRQSEKLPVLLQPFVEANIRSPLTNLVHEMLEPVPDHRPHAHELRSIFDDVTESGSFDPRSDGKAVGLYSRICQSSVNPIRAGQSRSIVFSVSYERNPYFSGRDEFLETLFRELKDEQPGRYNHRITLYGLGGVGKTQTALEYAYRHREDYAYVFWISGVDRGELFSGFHGIAKIVRCALSFTRLEDIAESVLHWLRVNENWLLIIDNLEDVAVISGYLPESNGSGHTIITTSKTDNIPATELEVSEMDHDTAVSFLLKRIHVTAPSEEIRMEAEKIVEVLGRLPLAIEQAADYIKTSDNISEFLLIFERSRRQLLSRRLPSTHVYDRTVATAWNLSLERLAESSSVAASLLAHLAFMNPDEILVDYLRAGSIAFPQALQGLISDPFEWNEALHALEECSLIRIFAKNRSKLRIHRLVQAVIQDGLEESKRRDVESAVIQIGLASFPILNEDLKERDQCRRFRSQVTACLEQTKSTEQKALWAILAERMASYLFLEGMYAGASQWWSTISSIRKEVFGEEYSDTLRSNYELARSRNRQGQIKDAFALANKTFAIQKRVLGSEHSDTLKSMDSVAELHGMLGQYPDAAVLATETLELRKRVLGPQNLDTLQSMNTLAVSYDNLGQFKPAADLKAETLKLRKSVLGAEHPDTLQSMNDLAVSYDNLGQFTEAADLKAETLRLMKRVLGAEHPDTLRSMNNLAVSYDKLGQFTAAADLDAETLKLKEKVLGAEHPDTLRSMNNLAVSYDKLGQFERAADLKAEALKLRKKRLGDMHPDTLRTMDSLTASYDKLEQFERAAELRAETLRLRTRLLEV